MHFILGSNLKCTETGEINGRLNMERQQQLVCFGIQAMQKYDIEQWNYFVYNSLNVIFVLFFFFAELYVKLFNKLDLY